MWLLYTLFYWTLPTIVVIFGLFVAKKSVKWTDLIIHGELLIYSITIVAGSTRLISKDMPTGGPFVNRQAFNLVSHIMIFPAIFTYGLLRYLFATANETAAIISANATTALTGTPAAPVVTNPGTASMVATAQGYPVSVPIIWIYSVLLLIAAFIFSYIVFLIDAQRSAKGEIPQGAANAIKHAPDKMNNEFEEIQEHEREAQGINNDNAPPPNEQPEERLELPPGEEGPAADNQGEELNDEFDRLQDKGQ
jgi:hypothetical protein